MVPREAGSLHLDFFVNPLCYSLYCRHIAVGAEGLPGAVEPQAEPEPPRRKGVSLLPFIPTAPAPRAAQAGPSEPTGD